MDGDLLWFSVLHRFAQEMEMEELEGYIEHIVFHNGDNGYTVMKVISEGEEIYCVGTLHMAEEGIQIALRGRYITHNQYGEQFQIEYTIHTQNVKGFRLENIPNDIEILYGPNTSSQSSYRIVNGHMSSSSSVTSSLSAYFARSSATISSGVLFGNISIMS